MGMIEKQEWTETKKEWILTIGGKRIPVSAIAAFSRIIFSVVCIALVFRIGEIASVEIIRMAENAHTTCWGDSCMACIPQVGGFGNASVIINCTAFKTAHPEINQTKYLNFSN
jgi:hypothetical protein